MTPPTAASRWEESGKRWRLGSWRLNQAPEVNTLDQVPELTSCPCININARPWLRDRSIAVAFQCRKLRMPGLVW